MQIATTIHFSGAAGVSLDVHELVAPLYELGANSASLIPHSHHVRVEGREWNVPKFLLLGQRGGGRPIRVALFAGLDAGSVETTMALTRLLIQLELTPRIAADYALFAYPIVNAGGFDAPALPLAKFERRYAAKRPDEDVRYFQSELLNWEFDGLISLRSDVRADGFHAMIRSEVIGREVVAPALGAIAHRLPSRAEPLVRRPSDRFTRLADAAHGKLVTPPSQRPYPFEVELFAPGKLTVEERSTGLFLIVQEILRNYRHMISHAVGL